MLTRAKVLGLVAAAAIAGHALPAAAQVSYCDPAIQGQIMTNGKAQVDAWTTLASQPGSGYTMIGGQSVLEAAGLLQSGSPGFVGSSGLFGSGGGTFGQASCLNNLIGSGLNITFSPPNLDSILNMIEQAACHEVQSLLSQATQPLSASLYQAFSLNGAVPGLNLGSIVGGASISVGQNSNGGLVNLTNGNTGASLSYGPDTGWYGGGGSGSTASYGSLFSNTQAPASSSGFFGLF